MRLLLLAALPLVAQPVYPDKADLLYYLDGNNQRHAVRSKKDWQQRRAHIIGNLEKVMGPATRYAPGPLDIELVSETKTATYVRRTITYRSEQGDAVPAHLFLPLGRKGKRPAALCLHQTTRIGKDEPSGLGGKPTLHYARELAERGWIAIAPDYPNFGTYKFDPYSNGYDSATMKGILNHRRAIDVLLSLPDTDPKRIATIGHSLGGHNSLFAAVFDERIRAVATSCGFNSFYKYFNGNIKGWSHKGYMPRIADLFHLSPSEMPFDFTEILGALAPRAVFINAPTGDTNFEVSGVHDCLRAARPLYEKIYRAPNNLIAVHPDTGHEFPDAVRQRAYDFLERSLR